MDILYKDVYLEIYKYCDYFTQILYSQYLADVGIYMKIRYPTTDDLLNLINADIQIIRNVMKVLRLSPRCIIKAAIKHLDNVDRLDYLLKILEYKLTLEDLTFKIEKDKPNTKLLRGIHDKYGYCFNIRTFNEGAKFIRNLMYIYTDDDCIFCKDFATFLLDMNSNLKFNFSLIPIKKKFIDKSIYKLKWNLLYL